MFDEQFCFLLKIFSFDSKKNVNHKIDIKNGSQKNSVHSSNLSSQSIKVF